jgi:hypothetical protein
LNKPMPEDKPGPFSILHLLLRFTQFLFFLPTFINQ